MDQTIDRRNFVAGAAAAAAGASLAFLGKNSQAALAAEDVSWDEECDVLVVGTGYAGLAAAYEAKKAGADVKLIEKLEVPGGNSMVADGDIAVCGSQAQKEQGVDDSIDTFIHDMQVAGLFLNDVEKCRVIAEKSNETWEWTRDVLGVEWQTDDDGSVTLLPYGGHSKRRTIHPVVGHGSATVLPLIDKLEEIGVEIEFGRMFARLVKDESGRVVGAEMRDGFSGNDVNTGTPCYVKAARGVVLASGGFSRDVTWRKQHDPRLDESVDCTNAAGATAEGLCAAIECGALPVHLDWIQCGPWCSPDEPGYGVAATWIDAHGALLARHQRPDRPPLRERAHRPQTLLRHDLRDRRAPGADRLRGQRPRVGARLARRRHRGRGHQGLRRPGRRRSRTTACPRTSSSRSSRSTTATSRPKTTSSSARPSPRRRSPSSSRPSTSPAAGPRCTTPWAA